MNTDLQPTDLATLVRARGAERLRSAYAHDQEERSRAWQPTERGTAFTFGECWTQCTFYTVDDLEAEIGFHAEILGLKPFVVDRDNTMFTTPGGECYIGIAPATAEQPAVHPNSVRLQFMVDAIESVTEELERRGVEFEARPQPCADGSPMWFGTLRAPSGVRVDLWGMVTP